jgi:hypothetical protein
MIRINSRVDLKTLHENLPVKKLKKESHDLVIKPPYPIAKSCGYSSCIEIIAPKETALNLLAENDNILGVYSISHIEIARDLPYRSEKEALKAFEDIRGLYKKYTSEALLYDTAVLDGKEIDFKYRNDPLLFSNKTLYLGPKPFQYVVYPRLSKNNKKPALHAEWRIRGASKIKNKTGIKIIQDLLDFDIPAFFNKQDNIQLSTASFDALKLGKWIRYNLRRKNYTEKELQSVRFSTYVFLNSAEIKSFADLKAFFQKRKDKIKSKTGRKTKRDLKYLNVDPNTFKKS